MVMSGFMSWDLGDVWMCIRPNRQLTELCLHHQRISSELGMRLFIITSHGEDLQIVAVGDMHVLQVTVFPLDTWG